ncbi:hypothetical protein [Longimicrobium sp.]|uniref:hypothetical protein n=1 Tax=Longimicrobium sp. TaxID=2029185 RepID=UPI002E36D2BB|nr:hypothetical protein [Longimicrobium sp.]HEX6042769.1 hypothetical protein [Longimicrobium sp.]
MRAIGIIDTSVFCNILNVPRRNQRRDQAVAELRTMMAAGDRLLLPLATIYETGNHIAQNADGRVRRLVAEAFVDSVRAAFSGDAPWAATLVPETGDFISWLEEFPDRASTGVGMADLSIIKAWEQQCLANEGRRVFIWSYDGDLQGYDRPPRI